MSFPAWKSFASQVHIGGALPVGIDVIPGADADEAVLTLSMPVRDCATGKPTNVIARESVFGAPSIDPIYRLVCRMYAHEAAEQITVEGARVLDPHMPNLRADFRARPVLEIGGGPQPVPQRVRFHDTSTGGTVVRRVWDFGDGTPTIEQAGDEIAAVSYIEHRYDVCGDYTVALTIYTSDGYSSTLTQTAQVIACDIVMNYDNERDRTFTAVPVGSVGSFLWDFGDGSTSQSNPVTHTYAEIGTYYAALTVTSEDGVLYDRVMVLVTVSE